MYTIYSKPGCPHCDNAMALLESLDIEYIKLVLDVGQEKDMLTEYYTVDMLRARVPNARTVPQIFEGENLVGGFEALKMHLSNKGHGSH